MSFANLLLILAPLLLIAGAIALVVHRPSLFVQYWLDLENWL